MRRFRKSTNISHACAYCAFQKKAEVENQPTFEGQGKLKHRLVGSFYYARYATAPSFYPNAFLLLHERNAFLTNRKFIEKFLFQPCNFIEAVVFPLYLDSQRLKKTPILYRQARRTL